MIRRRHRSTESSTSQDRWLVSYADFVTLLFGFFVVMYSVSQVSESKYRTLSETLSATFQGHGSASRGSTGPAIPASATPPAQSGSQLADPLELARTLKDALGGWIQTSEVSVIGTENWVQIDVSANLLFASASADPSAQARAVFARLATMLAPFDNEIEVAGHTDNLPIRTAQFESNWELSSARAAAVVKLLARGGVAPERLSAVGYGEFRPAASNELEEGRARNRRVVLLVSRSAAPQDPVVPVGAAPGIFPGTLDPASPDAELVSPPGPSAPKDPAVEPVRLKSGGLLFTTDPEASARPEGP